MNETHAQIFWSKKCVRSEMILEIKWVDSQPKSTHFSFYCSRLVFSHYSKKYYVGILKSNNSIQR